VAPQLYNDDATHLFAVWTVGIFYTHFMFYGNIFMLFFNIFFQWG